MSFTLSEFISSVKRSLTLNMGGGGDSVLLEIERMLCEELSLVRLSPASKIWGQRIKKLGTTLKTFKSHFNSTLDIYNVYDCLTFDRLLHLSALCQ